jgi:hypothetical protein
MAQETSLDAIYVNCVVTERKADEVRFRFQHADRHRRRSVQGDREKTS